MPGKTGGGEQGHVWSSLETGPRECTEAPLGLALCQHRTSNHSLPTLLPQSSLSYEEKKRDLHIASLANLFRQAGWLSEWLCFPFLPQPLHAVGHFVLCSLTCLKHRVRGSFLETPRDMFSPYLVFQNTWSPWCSPLPTPPLLGALMWAPAAEHGSWRLQALLLCRGELSGVGGPGLPGWRVAVAAGGTWKTSSGWAPVGKGAFSSSAQAWRGGRAKDTPPCSVTPETASERGRVVILINPYFLGGKEKDTFVSLMLLFQMTKFWARRWKMLPELPPFPKKGARVCPHLPWCHSCPFYQEILQWENVSGLICFTAIKVSNVLGMYDNLIINCNWKAVEVEKNKARQ